jgi:LPXTG-motif cell wall-anchored protein
MRKLAAMAVGVIAVAATTGMGAAGAQTATGGTVTVLHGIPDLTVDVYVNGDLTLDDFAPGTVTDPLTLPAGDYTIDIRASDAAADADPVLSGTATVTDGLNASVIANLDADGNPTINVFANNTAALAAGKSRLTVRHTAAAPAVDVRANGTVAFANLTNPNEATADLDAGTVSADVVLAGTETVVLGPADLDLAAGTSTIVYAWGSAEDENLDLMVQTISGLGTAAAPTGGDAELAETGQANGWFLALLATALLLGGGGAVVAARRRHA